MWTLRAISPTLLVVFAVLSGTASAQKTDAEIRDEIAFARGLAADWTFVDLAEQVLRNVRAEGVSSTMKEELALVTCDVFAVGAKNEKDKDRRNELYELALRAYEDFISDHAYSSFLSAAEAALVDTSALYARSLDLATEEAVGEEVQALKDKRIAVLRLAVDKTGDLISELEAEPERSEAQSRELYGLMLNRGRMLTQMASTEEDGTFSFDQATITLENLVFAAGDGTPFALRAYVAIGDCYAAQADKGTNTSSLWNEAATYYEAVVDMAIPRDEAAWRELSKDLTQADKDLRFLFLELAADGLVAAYANAGNNEAACVWALHYYNVQRREGFTFSPKGHISLLAVARVLLDSGGYVGGRTAEGRAVWYPTEEAMLAAKHSKRDRQTASSMALRIAQRVNEDNRGNTLQVKAQKLISAVVNQPGVIVAPDVLYDAAQGEYYERNYGPAVRGFKRVLAALENVDSARRIEFGPKVLWHIGRCYQKTGRHLEAAMAFMEGCTLWQGDPEFDSQNAQSFYRAMVEVRRSAPDQPAFDELYSEAENLAATFGAKDRETILFSQGEKLRRELKNFAGAIAKYAEVSPGSEYYEKALVNSAVSRYRLGDDSAALQAFDHYVDVFVNDPQNSIVSPLALAKRKEAMASAAFYRTLIAFQIAERAGPGAAPWERVLTTGAKYHEDFPEQDILCPWTMAMVMNAHLRTDNLEGAKTVHAKMVEMFPESKRTGAASLQFYNILKADQQAAAKAGDAQEAEGILREMVRLLALGNRSTAKPSFANLRQESRHWITLENWPTAEIVLERITARYADLHSEDMVKYILPDLGHVLLAQKKVAEAHEVLLSLNQGGKKTGKVALLDYCRSVSGWVEGRAGVWEVVPGAGESDEEFKAVADSLHAVCNAGDKWECEWYSHKFSLAYTYYQWGQRDSRHLTSARRQLSILRDELGPTFSGIEDSCKAMDEPALVEAFSGDILRRRFIKLWEKLQ
jgi:hypothetical protein